MAYYAFKNIRNGKLISGTDFSQNPCKQILEDNEYRTPLILKKIDIGIEAKRRKISPKTYRVVQVEVKEVQAMKNVELECPFCGSITEAFSDYFDSFCDNCNAQYYADEKMWHSRITGENRKVGD